MKKLAIVAIAGLASCFAVSSAQAAFIYNFTTASGGGFDVYNVFAFNDGTGGTGTKVSSFDLTLTTPGSGTTNAIRIHLTDIDGDGAPDANVLGQGLFPNTANDGSFIRTNTGFSPLTVIPVPTNTDSNSDFVPDQAIFAAYTNGTLHSLRIAGFVAGGIAANSGLGTPIAHVVIPTGGSALITGNIAGDIGSGQAVNIPIPVPEPASMALFGLGAMGLLGIRRRKA